MRTEISPEQPPGISLDQIVRAEVEVINIRRERLGRPALTVHETGPGSRVLDAVGLALSGGGIRSAAFSLGVLQSLNEQDVLQRVDYLSTVSGGGYMGASLTATMTKTEGGFVFGKSTGVRAVAAEATQPADVKDSGSVGHIRNYSNYLIPRGARDLVTALAIVVRGLVANVALVLPLVLLLAAITILGNPNRSDLTGRIGPDFLSLSLDWLPVKYFGITLLISLIGLVLFFAWGIYRSLLPAAKQSEFRTWLPTIGASYLIVIAASFFCELQPFVISGMFSLADASRSSGQGDHSVLTASIQWLATIATPVAAAVTFFRQQLGTLLKSVDTSSRMSTKIMALAVKGAIWIAGAALPLLIWIAFIYLCYWGIINDGTGNGPGDHTPKWLIRTAEVVSSSFRALGDWLPNVVVFRPVTLLYVVVGILLFGLSYLLRPNANSLHQLYRDRLSKAFLFDPTELARTRFGQKKQRMDQGRDFAPLDTMRISELVKSAPLRAISPDQRRPKRSGLRLRQSARSQCRLLPVLAVLCRQRSHRLPRDTAGGICYQPRPRNRNGDVRRSLLLQYGGEFDPAAHADARDLERPDGLLAQKSTLYRVFDGCSERFNARTGADDQMVPMVRDYWTTL